MITGTVINKNVLIEKVVRFKSKDVEVINFSKKIKYSGIVINDINAQVDVREIDNGTFPLHILVA